MAIREALWLVGLIFLVIGISGLISWPYNQMFLCLCMGVVIDLWAGGGAND